MGNFLFRLVVEERSPGMLEQELSLIVVWGELEMAGSMTRALGTNIYLLLEKLNLTFQNHLEI